MHRCQNFFSALFCFSPMGAFPPASSARFPAGGAANHFPVFIILSYLPPFGNEKPVKIAFWNGWRRRMQKIPAENVSAGKGYRLFFEHGMVAARRVTGTGSSKERAARRAGPYRARRLRPLHSRQEAKPPGPNIRRGRSVPHLMRETARQARSLRDVSWPAGGQMVSVEPGASSVSSGSRQAVSSVIWW